MSSKSNDAKLQRGSLKCKIFTTMFSENFMKIGFVKGQFSRVWWSKNYEGFGELKGISVFKFIFCWYNHRKVPS